MQHNVGQLVQTLTAWRQSVNEDIKKAYSTGSGGAINLQGMCKRVRGCLYEVGCHGVSRQHAVAVSAGGGTSVVPCGTEGIHSTCVPCLDAAALICNLPTIGMLFNLCSYLRSPRRRWRSYSWRLPWLCWRSLGLHSSAIGTLPRSLRTCRGKRGRRWLAVRWLN